MENSRRRLLTGTALLAVATLAGWHGFARKALVNPCRAALPDELARHELVRAAWDGIDANLFWDCHVHLAGIGDSDSGIVVGPQLDSILHPLQYAQRLFYMNAGCAHDAPGRVDASYVERLHNLVDGLAPGARLMLFAFDRLHDEDGRPRPEASAFHVPDAYARAVAQRHPAHFEWVASIHPYRADAVEALAAAVAGGARAVKWLPAAMGIDPSHPRCDPFFAALAAQRLPLITHAGEEKAVHGGNTQQFGNPLLLRRALDHGVRVVVAHCASLGEDVDLDRGRDGPVLPSFDLFARMMDEARYANTLFADISAVTQRNRAGEPLRVVIERSEWHPRLLNGTDYPLPGILPLFAPAALAAERMLDAAAVPVLEAIRDHNPLLFDFVLKRHLVSRGRRLPASVFETRRFFDPSFKVSYDVPAPRTPVPPDPPENGRKR